MHAMDDDIPHAIAAVTHRDPYPWYARRAARDGLFYDRELRLWVAASARAVGEVLAHADCRVRPPAEPVPAAIAGGAAGQVFGALVRMNDGERHAVPGLALRRALAALDAAAARQRAARVAAGLASVHDLRAPDGLSAWMFGVPVRTVASLLGFPDTELPRVAVWMGEFVACLSPLSGAEQIDLAHGAALALLDGFSALTRSGAAAPGSLLALVAAEAEAAGWDHGRAILANLVGLLSQTYEATAGLIGNSVVALLREPGRASAGCDALVLGVMRDDPPIQNTRRFMACATQVCGVQLEAGQAILLLLAAAGRDVAGAAHSQGGSSRPYGYGRGVHACPGDALSLNIASAALEALLERAPPANMDWRYRPSVNARVPEFIHRKETA
ncbi:cytochrome [Pseudoduganella namucuonensis]|uniref:Cytochrome P450 n=1 Tax=Pseudoduganella namucuonensis TaxID=1035707 RepID=A0A1I7EY42_9BURK|nr:cytochrome [Pseudoduganella namucuonensis]SFU28817.1 Cytochrome P450 [Pseudoduganella namucuonensis]